MVQLCSISQSTRSTVQPLLTGELAGDPSPTIARAALALVRDSREWPLAFLMATLASLAI